MANAIICIKSFASKYILLSIPYWVVVSLYLYGAFLQKTKVLFRRNFLPTPSYTEQ